MVFRKLLSRPLEESVSKKLISDELERIVENCLPESVYLFGSASRGEMTDTSDLDFLVVMADIADMKGLKSKYYRSSGERTVPVDTIFVTRSEFEKRSRIGGVCFVVADEGKLLYSSISEIDHNGEVKKI